LIGNPAVAGKNLEYYRYDGRGIRGTREEIVLLFGMNQAWYSGQKEVTIQLADRIVMSPFVAKRLATLLNNVMKDYESKYGTLDI
jgi:hypothetical protein